MPRLIPFSREHFPVLASWFGSQAEVVQWGGPLVSFPLTVEQLDGMLAEATATPPSRLCWMAARDGAFVGHAQLAFDWRNGNASLSRVAVAPSARGGGLAVPMLRLVVAEAFSRSSIQRLELNVYTWNAPAIRTYCRLGFQREGVRRSSARVGEERWDTAIMGLLRHEWTGNERPVSPSREP